MHVVLNLLWMISMLCWLPACGQMSFDEKMKSMYRNTVPQITTAELMKKGQDENRYLLDIRTREEYAVSHIPGARLVQYEQFQASDVAGIPKDAEITVYCSVGYRSERIGEALQELGYHHVKNLYGGIFDWKNQGQPVINTKNQSTDSVHTYNEKWSQWLYKGIKVYE